jgi:hemerythrin-like metal-binding protein
MIDPITWTTEIATGIIWQDYQHKELLGVINTLREKVSAESDIDSSNIELINWLLFYTRDHLGVEEKYMDLLKYPGAKQHKEEHMEFLNKVNDLKKITSFSVGIKTAPLFNDLAKWFFKHINNTDQRLGAFLKDKGIR